MESTILLFTASRSENDLRSDADLDELDTGLLNMLDDLPYVRFIRQWLLEPAGDAVPPILFLKNDPQPYKNR